VKRVLLLLAMALLTNSTGVQAKNFSYWQVHNMPQGVEKDYYIWRFLSQPATTAFQATDIIKEVDHLNKKLRTVYKQKTGFNAPTPSKHTVISRKVTDWKRKSEANRYFRKGILLLQQNQLQKAADAFYEAHNKYEERWERDKCLFWLYMLTKDKEYLAQLKKSYHINMYTLLAADFTKSKYPRTIVVPKVFKRSSYRIDAKNPIHWAKIKAKMNRASTDLDDLADDCKSQETIGMYSYLKAKACHYKKSYFPMPYKNIMKKYSKERQALLYAIARQESRFVPASVSRSFALGMMQFMPFLVKHVAKKKGERIDLDEMFNPKKAIEYADYHLDYLQKYLMHPLFVAYAYNGGIGFTKRVIRQKNYFRKNDFEPYLSMEKMTNVEAREYGKRVLTNYVVYLNKLGKPTRLLPYIQMLTDPSKTDRFRK
jgi:soluble lytic murein transglycosylase